MNQQDFVDMWNIMIQYDLEIVDEIFADYKCGICNKILINACNVPCGCRYCRDCLEIFLKCDHKFCPGQSRNCGKEIINIDTDIQCERAINIRISRLRSKCPNAGCDSIIELNSLRDHLAICQQPLQCCPFYEIGCENDKIINNKMNLHLLSEILPHTRLLINSLRGSQKQTESLKGNVDKLDSENTQLKQQIEIDKQEAKTMIQDLRKKDKDNSAEMELLDGKIRELKVENKSIKSELLDLRIFKDFQLQQNIILNIKIDNQTRETHRLIEIIEQQNLQIKELTQRCDEISDRLNENEGQFHEISRDIADMKTESTDTIQSLEKIRNMTFELSKNFNCVKNSLKVGDYIWQIDDWNDKVKQAENNKNRIYFYSDEFFTHSWGYKVGLALGIDRYVYLYFWIFNGDFDDILNWPFDRIVELSLINQKTGLPIRTLKVQCSRWPNHDGLKKPISDKNQLFYLGCLDVPLAQISEDPALSENNQILIKFVSFDKLYK